MGYAAVAELAHELETVLDALRRPVRRTLATFQLLFRAVDALGRGVEAPPRVRDGGGSGLCAALARRVAGGRRRWKSNPAAGRRSAWRRATTRHRPLGQEVTAPTRRCGAPARARDRGGPKRWVW